MDSFKNNGSWAKMYLLLKHHLRLMLSYHRGQRLWESNTEVGRAVETRSFQKLIAFISHGENQIPSPHGNLSSEFLRYDIANMSYLSPSHRCGACLLYFHLQQASQSHKLLVVGHTLDEALCVGLFLSPDSALTEQDLQLLIEVEIHTLYIWISL